MVAMRLRRYLSESSKALMAFILVAFVCPVAAAGTMLATQLFVPLPAIIPEQEQQEAIQFSEVYDINGDLIHTYKQFDQNIPVNPSDIPEVVKKAVIAAEDRNFYKHEGFDVRGTLRALITDIRTGELAEGGSTITQQLAKNAYGSGTERTFGRKIREAVLASQLDRSLSKDEIMYQYLSIVYMGEGAYGIGAAAQVYFNKPVNQLDLSESAILAGLLPAPSRFNPRADTAAAEIRRKQVLDAMLEEGLINKKQHAKASRRKVWLQSQGDPGGPATIVSNRPSEATKYPWFIQYLTQYLIAEFGAKSDDILNRGGYQIYTTLDPKVQAEAEATVAETLEGVEPRATNDPNKPAQLQMSITAVEPPTGYVRAMVGGRDWNLTQANIATGTGTANNRGRQPGSSFKAFVLAEAFEQGITPSAVYSGGPLTIGDYSPENYGGSVYGSMSLRSGTQKSVNTVFVRLMQDVGPYEVVDLARKMGLNIPPIDPSVDGSGLQIALGTREVTTLEMASAYGTFGNRGIRQAPTPVVRVFDAENKMVVDNSEPQGKPVIKQATADNVTDVLRGVLTSGTAAGRDIGRPAAGKTGTTQENTDGWFVGYTPTLSTAVFMGWDPIIHGNNTVHGVNLTGGSYPARAWQRFMQAALEGVPETDFFEPAPIVAPASEELQRERRGFSPGSPHAIAETGSGGPYVVASEAPIAPAATSSTTTSTTTTSTTSTTIDTTSTTRCRGFFCDGDDDE